MAQRWMWKMGYWWMKKLSGQYVDGHEQADVVYYHQMVFLQHGPSWIIALDNGQWRIKELWMMHWQVVSHWLSGSTMNLPFMWMISELFAGSTRVKNRCHRPKVKEPLWWSLILCPWIMDGWYPLMGLSQLESSSMLASSMKAILPTLTFSIMQPLQWTYLIRITQTNIML